MSCACRGRPQGNEPLCPCLMAAARAYLVKQPRIYSTIPTVYEYQTLVNTTCSLSATVFLKAPANPCDPIDPAYTKPDVSDV